MEQYSLCKRSVLERADNLERGKFDRNTPAGQGSLLHLCLKAFADGIGDGKSVDEAIVLGIRKAKEHNVYSEFVGLNFDTLRTLAHARLTGCEIDTEISAAKMKDGRVVRVKSYRNVSDAEFAGTADIVAIDHGSKTCFVMDWKTGDDEVNEGPDNLQLLSLAHMLCPPGYKCWIAIVKPQNNSYSSWPVDRLEEFKMLGGPEESAGDHCRYCPLRGNCVSFMDMSRKEVNRANFRTPDQY